MGTNTTPNPPSPSKGLLRWYRKNGRNLPWRDTRDPYKILVSEIMLQQTQVDRVKEFYKKWLTLFPNWNKLAKATNAEVIHAWAGLGYNRRALALRDIAKQVKEKGLPSNREEWLQLKGIGPYTSAAIAAFAHKQRELPIDTNIRRVLGRYYLGKPYPELKDDKQIDALADRILPQRGAFYDVPQAIFDLATIICTKTPSCSKCPLRKSCQSAEAFLTGKVSVPKRSINKPKETRYRNKKHPDRIYRGRILKMVREHKTLHINELGSKIDKSFDKEKDSVWVKNMVKRMIKDGLLSQKNQHLSL